MPFGIGMPELMIVAVIIVLLFGGKFFKDLGTGVGGFIRELRSLGKKGDE